MSVPFTFERSPRVKVIELGIVTRWANKTSRPTQLKKIIFASLFGLEPLLKLQERTGMIKMVIHRFLNVMAL